MLSLRIVVLLLSLGYCCQSYRILGIFPYPARSHVIPGATIMKALAEKGHEVIFINSFPQKTPIKGFTEIILDVPEEIREFRSRSLDLQKMGLLGIAKFIGNIIYHVTNGTINNPQVQELLHSNITFDVVVLENFLNEAMMGFAEHFNCPFVLVTNTAASELNNDLVGNPSPYSYIHSAAINSAGKLTFFQRVMNTVLTTFVYMLKHFINYPFQNKVLQTQFNTTKSVWDIIKEKAPLILLNSHPSITQPAPHVPSMIEIGGFHTGKLNPLPEDLQEFLDNAVQGVVYFSMGSNLQSSQLPADKREALISVFSKLKQKVLWKWEDEYLPGQPTNLKIGKWLPQQEILAHPNVKVFITHGGFGGCMESLYHGVPMVVIPMAADQKMNAATAVNNGYAVQLEYDSITEETLTATLREILDNPSYTENVKRRSALLKDQPIPPLDAAVFWIEHVIRHGGAHHLTVGALDLAWYEYLLLDVIAFIVAVTILVVTLIHYAIKKLLILFKKGDSIKNSNFKIKFKTN